MWWLPLTVRVEHTPSHMLQVTVALNLAFHSKLGQHDIENPGCIYSVLCQ